jgi:DNA-binding CsgD family transcriptional regulator
MELRPYEIQILELLSEGKVYKEIAEVMRKSKRTIEHQAKVACIKLGCKSQAHSVAEAIRKGIIQ